MLTSLEQRDDLAQEVGLDHLFIKCEDQTPTGSFKYRSAERQMEHLVEMGKKAAVISSSGNAAISLAYFAKREGIRLFTFVSPDIAQSKLCALALEQPIIIISRRAMRLANYLSAKEHLPNLRPSVDDHAVIGLVSLGEEIEEQMEPFGGADLVASFMTSGASMLGIARGIHERHPRLVAVTSEGVGKHGIRHSSRTPAVAEVASVVAVTREETDRTQKWLKERNISCAPEAAASFAWIIREKPRGNVVWVLSGKEWPLSADVPLPHVEKAETFADVDRIYVESR